MRLIKTFLVRLYQDSEHPEILCGDLRPLSERKAIPFKQENELIEQLRQAAAPPSQPAQGQDDDTPHP